MSTSSHPDSDGKSTYPVPSPPENSDDGIQSNTNNNEKSSYDQSMLNTIPASQEVLEVVNSSSPTILHGCPHEDGKHMDHRLQLLSQDKSGK
jgi:hypothetical protein